MQTSGGGLRVEGAAMGSVQMNDGQKDAGDMSGPGSRQGRFQLSDAQIQTARELGLNPKKFGSLANTMQKPWKLPSP